MFCNSIVLELKNMWFFIELRMKIAPWLDQIPGEIVREIPGEISWRIPEKFPENSLKKSLTYSWKVHCKNSGNYFHRYLQTFTCCNSQGNPEEARVGKLWRILWNFPGEISCGFTKETPGNIIEFIRTYCLEFLKGALEQASNPRRNSLEHPRI